MKKILLSLFTISALASTAQVEITLKDQATDISGTTIDYTIDIADENQIHLELDVYNRSSSTVNMEIRRVRLDTNPAWTDYLCWGQFGTCIPASQMTEAEYTTNLDEYYTQDAKGALWIYINPNDYAEYNGHYRYYVMDGQSTKLDSIDITVTKVASVVEKTPITFSMAPNPAKDFVKINVGGADKATVQVVDVLGNVVRKEEISQSTILNVADYRSGIYFITVNAEGRKAVTRKLIVRH